VSEDPEVLRLSALLRRLRERMSPEVRQAVVTIARALFEDKAEGEGPFRKKERERAAQAQTERIHRAERGVKTRRQNAEKRVEVKDRCMSISPGPQGYWCELSVHHRKEHRHGKYFWKRQPARVSLQRAKRK